MGDLLDRHVGVLEYLSDNLPDDPIYEWILNETKVRGIPRIQVTRGQGRLLYLLAKLVGARRILEVGALGGYSTVWLARALSHDGRLITLELSARHAALARESLQRAGLEGKTTVVVGPAEEALAEMVLDAPLDLMFIDADKPRNLTYLQWGMTHVRSGGLVLVDNVLRNGSVARGSGSASDGSLSAFNQYVFEHYNDETTIIPSYKRDEDNLDGLMIVRVP